MVNLISKKVRKRLFWHRASHLSVLALYTVTIFLFVATFIVSSILISIKIGGGTKDEKNTEQSLYKDKTALFDESAIINKLKYDAHLLGDINKVSKFSDSVDILNNAVSNIIQIPGVELDSINVYLADTKKIPRKKKRESTDFLKDKRFIFSLVGYATTRNIVSEVQQTFINSDDFIVNDFPVSNFEIKQNGKYRFKIDLVYKNK